VSGGGMMRSLGILDWALIIGVFALGTFLAIDIQKKYKVAKLDFFFVTFYVACLATVLIGLYQLLRSVFSLLT
jgi:hypothetical protein